jgi:hypothetical protein
MKIAICVSGQPRFTNFGAYHQKKFADMLSHDVDFYVQTWSQEGVEERADELFANYNPKRVRIDTQYAPTQYSDHFHKIRGLSQHYAHHLCQSQIEDINQYDVIIRTRHDTMINTDLMEEIEALIQRVYTENTVAGFGFYPDYDDEPYVTKHLNEPSHRGFSQYPTFDDWAIVGHRNQWKKFETSTEEFNKLLDEMFMDPRNEHFNNSYDLYGSQKKVCIPELVWYNLLDLNLTKPFYVGHGYAYLARPTLRGSVGSKMVQHMQPSDVRKALRQGWVNGAAVLQYSITI